LVTIRFTLTRSEVCSCYRRLQARQWLNWTLLLFGVAVAAVGIVISDSFLVVFGAVYGAGWAAYVWWLMPRRAWRRHAQLRGEQAVSVSEEGVVTEMINASTRAAWSFWPRARAVGDIYVLQAKHRGYCFIPRRAFASSHDELWFRDLVGRHTHATLGAGAARPGSRRRPRRPSDA
jgi:hypothetical protein